jgi:uncharacterized protein involved in response to NO
VTRPHRFAGALWSSGFRPFLLLGTAWGAVALPLWLGEYALAWSATPPITAPLWHGHEMLFGFAAAIIAAVLLTAIPTWAVTDEIAGGPLAALAAIWLAGRLAMLASGALPPALVAAADAAFLPALALVLAPTALRARRRWFVAPVAIVLALAGVNAAFHAAWVAGNAGAAARALEAGLLLVMLLFTLAGGLLIPVFTATRLRETGRGDVAFSVPLEVVAIAAVGAFAFAELAGATLGVRGAAALVAALANSARLARWQGWKVLDEPLVWALHLGYAWLPGALALRAAAALGGPVPELAWMHAFAVGGLGVTILALASRIALRHTGRPLVVPQAMVIAYLMMCAAAVTRVAAAFRPGLAPLVASGALWSAALSVYLACFAGWLVAPSRPRDRSARAVPG